MGGCSARCASGSAFRRSEPSPPADLELVPRALVHAGDEQLPDARGPQGAHRVHAPVPAVPVAHHAHRARRRRPDREGDAPRAVDLAGVRAQALPQALVAPLADQVQVELSQRGQERVGVARTRDRVAELHLDLVARQRACPGHDRLEQARRAVRQLDRGAAVRHHPDRPRARAPDAHRDAVGHGVGAEHAVRLVVVARGEEGDVRLDRGDRAHASALMHVHRRHRRVEADVVAAVVPREGLAADQVAGREGSPAGRGRPGSSRGPRGRRPGRGSRTTRIAPEPVPFA